MVSAIDRWQEEYETHSVWNDVENVIQQIEALESYGSRTQDEIDLALVRLKAVQARREAPAMLVTSQMLEALRNTLMGSVQNHLERIPNYPQRDNLAIALRGIDDVVGVIAVWPPSKDAFGRGVLASLRETSRQSERQIARTTEEIEEAAGTIVTRQIETTEEFEQLKLGLRSEVQTLLATASSELEKVRGEGQRILDLLNTEVETTRRVVDTFEPNVTRQTERLDDFINGKIVSFGDLETQWNKAIESRLRAAARDFTKSKNESRQEFDTVLESIKETSATELANLEKKRVESDTLVTSMAKRLTSSEYGEYAKRQKRQADWLFGMAMIVILGAFGTIL
jgi:hypothetical protein